LKEKHLYSFGEFTLNAEDHILTRGGENVPVTPKMFDLLLVFVQNPGRVLGKEFLLQSVWPDSFVEEGNITFNIRQLRKALQDDAQAPRFIETIPRRGYRFVTPVETSTAVSPDQEEASPVQPEAAPEPIPTAHPRRYMILAAGVAVALLAGVILGSWLLKGVGSKADPIMSTPFSSEKLSTTGAVWSAAISPNGKTVIYTSRSGAKTAVWLRQLDTGNNVPFMPASEDYYYLFNFSPDGQTIYFTRAKPEMNSHIDIYRISIFGGIPEKIVSTTEGWLSVSPDGRKVSFVRCPRIETDHCSLWIANSDGSGDERKLVTRTFPTRIADNRISPDGKRIAFAAGQSRNSANEFQLFEVDIETGAERELTSDRFFNVKAIEWLPSGNELLFTASQIQNKYFRIWKVNTHSGVTEPLSKDSEAYSVLSIDREGKQLISTQIKQDFNVFKFELDDPSRRTELADGARATIASDGRVYFASIFSGNDEVWGINLDGTDQRQLTNDLGGDGSPLASADGRIVFFVSNRSGNAQIWRMNKDGSNQVQVTRKEGGAPMFATTDGKILYYKHSIHGTLWSVSLETGEEKLVLNEPKRTFAFSVDGSLVAFEERVADRTTIAVVSMPDGQRIKTLEVPKDKPRLTELAFHPDGKTIVYLLSDVDYEDTSVYRQGLDGPAQKLGDLGPESVSEVSGLSISSDGKTASVVLGGWLHDAVLLRGLK
jgi:Tol biopolymer transport system component/DNA-binding winged helix-turn-helix (wHTH) protein